MVLSWRRTLGIHFGHSFLMEFSLVSFLVTCFSFSKVDLIIIIILFLVPVCHVYLSRSKRVFFILLRVRSKHTWAIPHWREEDHSKTYSLLGWKAFGSSRNNSCLAWMNAHLCKIHSTYVSNFLVMVNNITSSNNDAEENICDLIPPH